MAEPPKLPSDQGAKPTPAASSPPKSSSESSDAKSVSASRTSSVKKVTGPPALPRNPRSSPPAQLTKPVARPPSLLPEVASKSRSSGPEGVTSGVLHQSNVKLWIATGCVGSLCFATTAFFFWNMKPNSAVSVAVDTESRSTLRESLHPFNEQGLRDEGDKRSAQDSHLTSSDDRTSQNMLDSTPTSTEVSPYEVEPLTTADELESELIPERDSLANETTESTTESIESNITESIKGSAGSSQSIKEMIESAAKLAKARHGKEAISTLKKASGMDPKDIRPDFYLGLLYSGVGNDDPKVAAIYFNKVLDRQPGHVAALNNLALVEVRARKFEPARHHISQAANNSPRPREINQNIGRFLNKAQQLRTSAAVLKQVSALNTNPSDYHSETGWLYMSVDPTESSRNESQLFCIEGVLEDKSCVVCRGKKFIQCTKCGGRRYVLAEGSVTETRTSPIGSTTMTRGTATRVACEACGGTGRWDCRDCPDGRDPSLRK